MSLSVTLAIDQQISPFVTCLSDDEAEAEIAGVNESNGEVVERNGMAGGGFGPSLGFGGMTLGTSWSSLESGTQPISDHATSRRRRVYRETIVTTF